VDNVNNPYPGDTYAGDQRYGNEHDLPRRDRGRGRSPENVSAPDFINHPLSTDVARDAENAPPMMTTTTTTTRGGVVDDDDDDDDGGRRWRGSSRDGGTS
jgi:hypothetical protein